MDKEIKEEGGGGVGMQLEVDKLCEYVTGACATILGVDKDQLYKRIHSPEHQ